MHKNITYKEGNMKSEGK